MLSTNTGTAESKRKVFLVDDHPILREGFAQLINHEPDLKVCGQAGSAGQAMRAMTALAPDLVVVDINLKGINGIELIKQIKAQHPNVQVLALSVHDEAVYAERALRAGAKGYVMKQAPTEEVMAAIRRVASGGRHLSQQMQDRMLEKLSGAPPAKPAGHDLDSLSDRELEVFELIGVGLGTREIARRLGLSVKTVETYRAHLKEKLKVRSGVELMRLAVETSHQAHRGPAA